ncbi:MAG TPA: TolC family protein [Pyrinomonadaceae bacterium]|nr:TolC family protein [Pyrinomonadaceae bacterium]
MRNEGNDRLWVLIALLLIMCWVTEVPAQRKSKKKETKPAETKLDKLRAEFVSATRDYKSSLEKLVAIYERNVTEAEEKVNVARKLFADGLVSRSQVDESERNLQALKTKVSETRKQMETADTQIADVLVETQADAELARNLKAAKNGLLRSSSFIRFTGSAGWGLSDAWKIQRYFSDTFHKQLPIAVFGQGAIHEKWRLDHRNAMDISLHPDSAEGQALLNFLQKNGVPFLAFRAAIPGTATGPHIHIGRPSHRY